MKLSCLKSSGWTFKLLLIALSNELNPQTCNILTVINLLKKTHLFNVQHILKLIENKINIKNTLIFLSRLCIMNLQFNYIWPLTFWTAEENWRKLCKSAKVSLNRWCGLRCHLSNIYNISSIHLPRRFHNHSPSKTFEKNMSHVDRAGKHLTGEDIQNDPTAGQPFQTQVTTTNL